MGDYAIEAVSAVWLGVLTSISPCPLATNIVAVSFLGRRVDNPRMVFSGGLLYALGKAVAYVTLGALLLAGLMSAPGASGFLQRQMNRILGPLLIIVGLFLLGVLRVRLPGSGRLGHRLHKRFASQGVWGAAPLGALFALSFCPASAALFFGSLVPLALETRSPILLPSLYGAGTALPVVFFAALVALGARGVGLAFERLTAVERLARRLTAVIFIGVGGYMALVYTFALVL